MSTKCAAWNIITCPICLIWLRYQTILKTVQICPDSDTATAVNPDSWSWSWSWGQSWGWSQGRCWCRGQSRGRSPGSSQGRRSVCLKKKSPTDQALIVGKLKTNVATAALVPDVGRTPDVWSHNLSWPRINFAHNEFLSLQWIYSDIDLKKKRKKILLVRKYLLHWVGNCPDRGRRHPCHHPSLWPI